MSTQTHPHMYAENFPVCICTTRTCFNTRARCALIHGDVLNVHGDVLNGHTVFFCVSHHTTTPHTPHRPHTTPQHKTQHHTETDRDRQRQRKKTETEGEEGTKEKTTRQEQREERRVKREKIHFQCGGAWPFLVDGVLGLVQPVNARVLAC